MDQRTRRRVHRGAWLAFLVGAPLLLAYARGYRLPLSGPSEWRASPGPAVGAIVIKTIPRGATVDIDGQRVDDRTPTGLGSVAAGTHVLRVTKPGYRPWEKRLEIVGGRVHHFLFLRLLPERIREELVRERVDAVWRAPDGRVTVTREGTALRFFSDDLIKDADGAVVLPIPRSRSLELQWSPSGRQIAVLTRPSPLEDRLLGLVEQETFRFFPVRATPRFAGWVGGREERAVTWTTAGRLEAWAPRDQTSLTLAEDVTAAAPHPRGVVFARVTGASGGPVLSVHDGTEATPLDGISPTGPVRALRAAANGAVAVLVTDGSLAVRAPGEDQWLAVGTGIAWFSWSPNGEVLLFQTSPYELSLFALAKESVALPPRAPALLLRVSSPLSGVRWFPGSAQVLFMERDVLFLADVDGRGGHRVERLLETNLGTTSVSVPAAGSPLLVSVQRGGKRVLLRAHLLTDAD